METTDGKFAATVRVGEKGQIVIPKGAREMFDIRPGDTLLLLADPERGIAIVRHQDFEAFTRRILQTRDHPTEPED